MSCDVSVRSWDVQYPVDTGQELSVHKVFKRRPGRLLNVSCTFNLYTVSKRYILQRVYDVSKPSVSLRYQLRRLCDVLSWSVSLRYQFVRFYDVSNWSILFKHQWDVAKTFQIGPCLWLTSSDVAMTSHHGLRRPHLYET